MNYSEEDILARVREHYREVEKAGHEIFFVALQGSWNYGLGYEGSDIDTKALIIPKFETIVKGYNPISTTKVLENDEHVDIKDMRVMFNNFLKQNINYLEILFSNYVVINVKYLDEYKQLVEMRESIAHFNKNQALRCMAGMSMQKLKALQHPYPTIKDKIEKYGYDPKQLHHILRMNRFIKNYASGISFKECLIPEDKEYLIDIKKGVLSVDEAVKLAKETDEDTKVVMENNLEETDNVNPDVVELLNDVSYKVLKKRFMEEFKC